MAKIPYTNNNQTKKEKTNSMSNEITLANERIRDVQVRLIAEDGSNVGVVNTRDALYQARKSGLDLVAINQQVSPIVVKILDLNKYLYDQKRAAKERAKKSRESTIVTKEIQLRPVTDTHDVSVKAKRATEFLADNCKVKIIIKFRGREMAFTKLGFEIINQFLEIVGTYKFDVDPRLQGNSITTIISPLKVEKQ